MRQSLRRQTAIRLPTGKFEPLLLALRLRAWGLSELRSGTPIRLPPEDFVEKRLTSYLKGTKGPSMGRSIESCKFEIGKRFTSLPFVAYRTLRTSMICNAASTTYDLRYHKLLPEPNTVILSAQPFKDAPK